MKNFKNELLIGAPLLVLVLIKLIFTSRADSLNTTFSFMKKVPWSIPYVIASIVILYSIGRIPFFRTVSAFHKQTEDESENSGIIINENMNKEEVSLMDNLSAGISGQVATGFKPKNIKSTWREILATIIYGLIFFAFIIGFFVIMMIE